MPDDNETDPDAPPENHDMKTLREKAKRADDATERAEAAERKLAFVQAGIDPDDQRQKYFAQAYQGEMTATAIKAEAEAAGFLTQIDTSAPQGMTDTERAAFAATSEAAAAPHHEPPEVDVYAEFRGQSLRNTGESPEQFGIRLAQKLEAQGAEVAYDGPFREFPGDTGIIPRSNTPFPRRI